MSTAHARKNPDFLYPIRERGRKEIIIAPFDQILRVENEAIIVYMLEHLNEYQKVYPAIERLVGISQSDRFTISISFSPIELLSFLRGDSEHIEEDYRNLNDIQSKYDMSATSRLRLNIALPHLLLEKDVEKLYIVDSNMNDKKMKIIYEIFKTLCNKRVFAVNGDLVSFVNETIDHPTTIFLNSIDDIFKLTKENPEKVKDVYFLCNGSLLSNYEAESYEKGFLRLYKYYEWFEKCKKDQFCIVDFFTPIMFR